MKTGCHSAAAAPCRRGHGAHACGHLAVTPVTGTQAMPSGSDGDVFELAARTLS
jgi:hypothetical protein